MTCPYYAAHGTCEIATKILGRPCPAFAANCSVCQATATHEKPTEAVLGLVRVQAFRDGDTETLKRMASQSGSQPAPPTPEMLAVEMRSNVGLYPCRYRGRQTRVAPCQSCSMRGKLVAVYECSKLNTECTAPGSGLKDSRNEFLPACWACDARVAPDVDAAAVKAARCAYLDHPEHWAGRFRGGDLFIVCGGPSLARVDWSQFPDRGPMVLAINNAGAFIARRPDFWIAADAAGRFAPEIWHDAAIAKFYPGDANSRGEWIQERDGDRWVPGADVCDMPNVHRIRGGCAFDAATFFQSRRLQFGRSMLNAAGKTITTNRSTMMYALRLAVDLGFSTINIVGADFDMPTDGQQYAWDEVASVARAQHNHETYRWLNLAFKSLAPSLNSLGVTVWNCTDGGKLTAFPRRTFAEACDASRLQHAQQLSGLYSFSKTATKPADPLKPAGPKRRKK